MAPENEIALHCAQLRERGWFVRHHGARPQFQRAQRAAAIRAFGLAVRAAFNATDDFEPLMIAFIEALIPREDRLF